MAVFLGVACTHCFIEGNWYTRICLLTLKKNSMQMAKVFALFPIAAHCYCLYCTEQEKHQNCTLM
jgi:hypothetical protein